MIDYIKNYTTGAGGNLAYQIFNYLGKYMGHNGQYDDNSIIDGSSDSYIYQLFDINDISDMEIIPGYFNPDSYIIGEGSILMPMNPLQSHFGSDLIAECEFRNQRYKATGIILNKPFINICHNIDECPNGIHFSVETVDDSLNLYSIVLQMFFISEDHKSLLTNYCGTMIQYDENNHQFTLCKDLYPSTLLGSHQFGNVDEWYLYSLDDEGNFNVEDSYSGFVNQDEYTFSNFISGTSSIDIESLKQNGENEILLKSIVAFDSNYNIISDLYSNWNIDNETGIVTAGSYLSGYNDNDVAAIGFAFTVGNYNPETQVLNAIGSEDIKNLTIYSTLVDNVYHPEDGPEE